MINGLVGDLPPSDEEKFSGIRQLSADIEEYESIQKSLDSTDRESWFHRIRESLEENSALILEEIKRDDGNLAAYNCLLRMTYEPEIFNETIVELLTKITSEISDTFEPGKSEKHIEMGLQFLLSTNREIQKSGVGIYSKSLKHEQTQKSTFEKISSLILDGKGPSKSIKYGEVNLDLANLLLENRSLIDNMLENKFEGSKYLALRACLSVNQILDYKEDSWAREVLDKYKPASLYVILNEAKRRSVPEGNLVYLNELLHGSETFVRFETQEKIEAFVKDAEVPFENKAKLMAEAFNVDYNLGTSCFAVLFDTYMSNYGFDRFDTNTFRSRWLYSVYAKDKYMAVFQNLIAIEALETERKGLIRTLRDEFNIYDFARYPQEMLIAQYDERDDTSRPFGAILYAHADHSGALYKDKEVLSTFFTDVDGRYAIRVYEESNNYNLARSLISANQKYGELSFALISGHGKNLGITLGLGDPKKHELSIDTLQGLTSRSHRFFVPGAQVLIDSCETAKDKNEESGQNIENLAQHFSEKFGVEVIAPKVSTNIKDIIVIPQENGKLRFDLVFNKPNVGVIYSLGKKQAEETEE